MELCIETHLLTHRFQRGPAVLHELNLQVPKGAIYGFLGPNGAGKTTTLRALLGLTQPTSGDIRIFGKSLAQHRLEILRRTGSLIESPSIYAHLTAKENLRIWQTLLQCPPKRINEVLHQVGLADTGEKKTGKFSLGMKQRLSLATALLHSPELLILDEPTNGLDPQGIIEMRILLKEINAQHGVTIVVSSHLLSEVEKLITHIGILHQGKMKFQGTWESLSDLQQKHQGIYWRSDRMDELQPILGNGRSENGYFITPHLTPDTVASLVQRAVQAGISLYEVRPQTMDLETVFLNIIQNENLPA